MKHDILGKVERTNGDPFDGVAVIRYGSRDIKVGISRDDQPFETTLSLAAEVVLRLPELDRLAKRVAVADLRESYNNGWNEYDEAQEDGSLKTVSNQQLSAAEFEAKLSLNAVNVTGDRMIVSSMMTLATADGRALLVRPDCEGTARGLGGVLRWRVPGARSQGRVGSDFRPV
jgi:hypothetical protein